jgi:hypothetical protein
MIRKPHWLADRLIEIAHDILNDKATLIYAAEDLADKIRADDRDLSLRIIEERCRSWIKQEMHKLVRAATRIVDDEGHSGQAALMPLPFPWLPAYLEVAPGRVVHQQVMTGPDWDNSRAIWQNRRDQAEISWQGFQRAYELIRDLLTDDVTMTADVVDQLRLDFDEGDDGDAADASW